MNFPVVETWKDLTEEVLHVYVNILQARLLWKFIQVCQDVGDSMLEIVETFYEHLLEHETSERFLRLMVIKVIKSH